MTTPAAAPLLTVTVTGTKAMGAMMRRLALRPPETAAGGSESRGKPMLRTWTPVSCS